jgi:tetraacyldisaccharide-1-P 4'-kinase
MTMSTLNQVSQSYDHQQFVCESIKDQIQAAQAHINTTRKYLVHIDWNDLSTNVYISECPFSPPQERIFGVSQPSLERVLKYLYKECVTVSPIGPSSAMDGKLLGVTV